MAVENIDGWKLPPSVDLVLVDSAFAQRLREQCTSGDTEGDGCQADKIVLDLLRKLGMAQTAEAYEALDLWRA